MTRWRLAGVLLAVFVAAHAACWNLGVRFDEHPLTSFWQVVDVELLRGDLARSLLYLHCQPPLWNLYLGLVVKAFPTAHAAVFGMVALAAGLALYVALVSLMERLGATTTTAVVASTLFATSPSFVLHEHLLFHPVPLATALTLSAILVDEVVRRGRAAAAFGLYAALVALAGTWGLFHLVHLLMVTVGLLALVPERRRIVAMAALPAVVLIVGLYAKNLVLFGHFAPSTWIGMNVARITVRRLPRETREHLIEHGILSPVAGIRPFAPLDAYPAAYERVPAHGEIPCLREAVKSTGGPNLNHFAYVALSEQYLRDSLAVVRRAPRAYLDGLEEAWLDYASSTSESPFLGPNRERLGFLVEVYDRWVYGRVPWIVLERSGVSLHLYAVLALALPLAWIFGMRMALGGGDPAAAPERVLALYLCFNIAWVALVGNSLEVGENERFRFVTDPLSVALLGVALQRLAGRVRGPLLKYGAGRLSVDSP